MSLRCLLSTWHFGLRDEAWVQSGEGTPGHARLGIRLLFGPGFQAPPGSQLWRERLRKTLSDWELAYLHGAESMHPPPRSAQQKGVSFNSVLVTWAYTFIRNRWIVCLIPVRFAVYTFSVDEKVLKNHPLQLPTWMNQEFLNILQSKQDTETDAEVNRIIGTYNPACHILWSLLYNDTILINLNDYGYKGIR